MRVFVEIFVGGGEGREGDLTIFTTRDRFLAFGWCGFLKYFQVPM